MFWIDVKNINPEETRESKAWTAMLNDETEDNDEIEELEIFPEDPQEIRVLLIAFVTQWDVIEMIANENKKN